MNYYAWKILEIKCSQRSKYLKDSDTTLFGMYVVTFLIRMLPEKDTVPEFLKSSERIPEPSDFSGLENLKILGSDGFGFYLSFRK